jgi:hypothetical protein
MMSTAGQAVALPEAANWNTSRPAARRPVALRPVALRLDARQASLQQPWRIHDTIAIPTRGILMGTLLSSCLWAALIVGGRALWLYLR